jgi:benzoyl-CoA reductase/2-hydroxyglutaryl-CoA dehydratase subunit BcrC/BadD/HgdB
MALAKLLCALEALANERRRQLAEPERSRISSPGRDDLQHRPVVGYLCNYVPRELIAAAGAMPVRLSRGGSYESRTRGERLIRADACPFCKSCLGLLERDPLYRAVSLLIVPSMCDQLRRLGEVVEQEFGVPVWTLAAPRTRHASSRQFFRREVQAMARELQARTGPGITGPALARAMLQEEEKRSLLRAIEADRKAVVPVVTEIEVLRLVRAVNLLAGPECVAIMRQALLRMQSPVNVAQHASTNRAEYNGDRADYLGRKRLLLAGSIIAEEDWELVSMIEQRARIVADALCSGARTFRAALDVPVSDDRELLMTTLADYYFDQPGCIQRRPNADYYRLLRELIAEYSVQGVIYKTLLFCDGYSLEAVRLEKELGRPVLHLDADYGGQNTEQMRTRVEAFLEML